MPHFRVINPANLHTSTWTMPDSTGAKADYVEDASAPQPIFSETRPDYIFRKAVTHPSARFGRPREYEKEVRDEMSIERDVKVPVRDGVYIRCDILRSVAFVYFP